MTEAERRIDAFRLLYAAVTLPFGGVLGSLLAGVATTRPGALDVAAMAMLWFSLLALFALFAAVPVACEAIVRRRLPPGRFVTPAIVLVLLWCVVLMPSEVFAIPHATWLVVMSAWLLCCLTLCWLCHSADMKKSMLR